MFIVLTRSMMQKKWMCSNYSLIRNLRKDLKRWQLKSFQDCQNPFNSAICKLLIGCGRAKSPTVNQRAISTATSKWSCGYVLFWLEFLEKITVIVQDSRFMWNPNRFLPIRWSFFGTRHKFIRILESSCNFSGIESRSLCVDSFAVFRIIWVTGTRLWFICYWLFSISVRF